MDIELQEKLVNHFPKLYKFSKSFDCGNGWFDLIWELSKKLEELIEPWIEEGSNSYATQVKEKYGTLRFYMSCETEEMSSLIAESEKKSSETCEVCGNPGTLDGVTYWLATHCEEHRRK